MGIARRHFLGGAGACLFTATGGGAWAAHRQSAGPHTDSLARRLRVEPGAIGRVETDEREVFLTFDDGPDPAYTPTVLDRLDQAGVSATFFLIGRNALTHPDLVHEIASRGHVIGNHTQDHLWLDGLPQQQVHDQITACERSFASVGVATTGLFRSPRGWTSDAVRASVDDIGLRSAFWTDCVEAFVRDHGPRGAAERIAGRMRPGSVILTHDGGALDGPNPQRIDRSGSVAALPYLIDAIRDRGFTIRPVAGRSPVT